MPEHPIDPASLVGIARYPLDSPEDHRYRNTRSLIQAQLEQDGCTVIPGFLSTHGLSQLMSFPEKPGMIGSVERTRELYGKVADAHLQAQAQRVRADNLMD